MRVGPIAHGALLAAALVFAYQTWTRDTTEAPKVGSVNVWQESMDDFVSFAFDGESKSVRVERRQDGDQSYYWGQVTRTEKKAKPRVPVKAPDEGEKGAGDPHGGHGMPGGGAPGGAGPIRPKPGGAAAPTPPGKSGPAKPGAPAPGSGAAPAKPAAGAGAGSSTKPPAQGLSPHHAGTDQEKKPGTPPAQPGAQPSGGQAKPAGDKPADKPGGDKPAGDKPADKPAGDKPADKPAGAGQSTGDTGDEAAEGDEADESAPEPPEETTSKVTEFPIGKGGQLLIANLVHLRALRDLGVLTDAQKEEYALVDSKENLTVFFKNKKQHSLIIGSRIFGGGDRYVMDAETGRGYVLSNSEIMRHVDGGENSLGIKNLHSFQENAEDAKATPQPGEPQQPNKKKDKFPGVGQIEMEATQGSRAFVRHEKTDAESGGTIIGWADKSKPGEADMTFDNFLAQIERLRPVEYDATLDASKLTKLLTLRYKNPAGGPLGTFELYRKEPAVTPEIEPSDENQRRNQPEYYVKTELTRVPGKISRMAGERVTEDVPQLFGAPPKKKSTKATPGGVVPAPAAGQPADKTAPGKAPAPSGADNAAGGAADKKGQDKAGAGKPAPASPSANPAGSKSNPTEGNK